MKEAEDMLAEAKRMLKEGLLSPREYAEKAQEIQNLKNGFSRIDDLEKRNLSVVHARLAPRKSKKPRLQTPMERGTFAPLVTALGGLILSIAAFAFWAPENPRPMTTEANTDLERHDAPLKASPTAKSTASTINRSSTDSDAALSLFVVAKQAVDENDIKTAKAKLLLLAEKHPCSMTKKTSGMKLANDIALLNQTFPFDTFENVKWLNRNSSHSPNPSESQLLVFWETWCPHCIQEMPEIQQTSEMIWGPNIDVIGLTKLSRNTPIKSAKTWLNKTEITFPNGKDNGQISSVLRVEGVPFAVFLHKGKIIWRGHPSFRDDMMFNNWANGENLPEFGPNGLNFILAYEGYRCREEAN